jgi:hypothetical protein
MLLLSVFLWAPFLTMTAALGTDDDEHVPPRTPLVDLCAWFPSPMVARLVPRPRAPKPQAYFTGEVLCDWVGDDARTELGLIAYRPSGVLTPEKEVYKAREFYTSKSGSGESAGIGEMSTVTVRHGSDYTEAHVVVLDGILVAEVTYRMPGKRTDIAGKAKEAAVELLKLLPPKGL